MLQFNNVFLHHRRPLQLLQNLRGRCYNIKMSLEQELEKINNMDPIPEWNHGREDYEGIFEKLTSTEVNEIALKIKADPTLSKYYTLAKDELTKKDIESGGDGKELSRRKLIERVYINVARGKYKDFQGAHLRLVELMMSYNKK